MKKVLGSRTVHCEVRKGTEKQAADYCKEDGLFYEWGTMNEKGHGTRTDVAAFRELVFSGQTDIQLMEADFNAYNRFQRSIDRFRSLKKPVRKEDLQVFLYIGKPGTGKTKKFEELYGEEGYAFPIGKDLWSDGYQGQVAVCVDDFCGGMQLKDVLRFLDRYPIQIPRKGGFNWWSPDVIVLTTNVHPKDWYNYSTRTDSAQALRRRIHNVFNFDKLDEFGEPKEEKIEDFWPLFGDVIEAPIFAVVHAQAHQYDAFDYNVNEHLPNCTCNQCKRK